jgi:hypothetical protein
VIAHDGARTTKDIDLLVDASPQNIARVKRALRVFEDRAVDDVAGTDVARYAVVRVADEIVVDLMARACGIEYADAMRDVESLTVAGVVIPAASLATLIRTKDTTRPSDAAAPLVSYPSRSGQLERRQLRVAPKTFSSSYGFVTSS